MNKNLTVLLLYNPSNEIRGKMRRYFYEVKANTFVGTISAGVRDTLWENLIKTDVEASMIIHTNNEQGFIYKTTKTDTNYVFEDFDGIILPTTIDTTLKLTELYAKSDYKLMDHLLDVGYIAEALMRYGRAYNMINAISNKLQLNFDNIVSSICWLSALHDIGKAHPAFVTKMYMNSNNEKLIELYESLKERKLLNKNNIYDDYFRHERFSRDILKNYFINEDYPIEAEQFATLVAYHHQGKQESDFCNKIILNNSEWLLAHNKIINEIEKHWQFDKVFSKNIQYCNGVNYSILSILITADWIASGTQWRQKLEKIQDKKACAKEFIKQNQLDYISMQTRFNNVTWDKIFSFKPNDMQTQTINAAKDRPQVMIVEYPCGGGKTEAALAAALAMGQNMSGIFIATPTMSTAKGMVDRMNVLAKQSNLDINIPEFDSSSLWSDADMMKIPSELWVSKTRHRLLYPFAVGTIDQILKTILYYRYAAIGLLGLSDKVLIIDEVHAYDSYMRTELKVLLQWAQFLDIPVILLSATLPTITKLDLLKSIGYKKDLLENSEQYPLITTFKDGDCQYYPISCEGREFNINIIETANYMQTWQNELTKQYPGCSAFITGTVDKAWEIYNISQNINCNTMLFHGRDTLAHKENKTKLLIKQLGKARDNRPNNLTLISTSIIEQSLDIDLDRMITCIAPIDLLIQRFGRVWRHNDKNTIRESEIITNPLNIIIPKNLEDASSTKIYSNEILQRTIDIIKNMTTLNTVTDARRLIDFVYNSQTLIEKPKLIMDAKFKTIEDPKYDAMFDNDNLSYSRFKILQSATRYETYPTVSIAIIESDDITDIENNYSKIKYIIQNCVVGISLFKLQDIAAKPIKFKHKLLSDINFYYKDDLLKQQIELTEDGLKWTNNWTKNQKNY